jgi:DNA-binding transcriptional LysR family regulator
MTAMRIRPPLRFAVVGAPAVHELMIAAALSGVTLAYVWEARALPHLESGRLVECLVDWRAPEEWLHLYYPTRRHLSAGMRAVIEALR